MQNDTGPHHDASREGQIRKLRLIAHVAEWVALGGMALVVAYSAYLWSNPIALTTYLQRDVPGLTIAPDGSAVILAGLLNVIPTAIFVAAMWVARSLFRVLGKSQFLDPAAPHLLVRLGGLAIAAAGAGVVVRTLVVLIMTSAHPPGQRHLVIAIGSSEISALVAGLLFLAFALMVQESLRIEDENRSIV